MVKTVQEKCSNSKGCVLFIVPICSEKGKDVEDAEVLKRYLVLQHFQVVYPIKSTLR